MEVALCVWLEDNDGDCRDTIKLVYEDMRQKAKQSDIAMFFTNSFVFPSAMHCVSCDYPDNFELGSPTLFQYTPASMHSRLLIFMFHLSFVPPA